MLETILDGSLMPHGYCLLWRPDLLFMTLVGDGLTFIAYSVIPVLIIYLVKMRKDLKFDGIFLLFAAFIAFCGLTHAISILNIWNGYYFLEGAIKLATGLISILTAIVLWRLMPQIFSIPSQEELNNQNEKLRVAQKELKQANQNLEVKVKQRTEELEKLAVTDSLTKLKNRRAIMEVLETEFNRTERYQHSLSVLMLDIDFFKVINDTFGHLEGDKVLVKISDTIKQACRKEDSVGRFGGEEFLIVLPQTDLNAARKLAERIRCAIADNIETANEKKLTCSIGISTVDKDKTMFDLIQKADDRCYKAKELGRNMVVYED